jgi:hypothetical protein
MMKRRQMQHWSSPVDSITKRTRVRRNRRSIAVLASGPKKKKLRDQKRKGEKKKHHFNSFPPLPLSSQIQ